MPKYNFVCPICQKDFITNYPDAKVCSANCRAVFSNRIRYRSPKGIASTVIKFWAKFDRSGPNGCWTWTGDTDDCGYGLTKFKGKRIRTHRLAYLLTHGEFPDDLLVCHWCDNPPCGNPAHLWLGTDKDNAADKVAKGRQIGKGRHTKMLPKTQEKPITHVSELLPYAKKLDPDKAREIRKLYATSKYSYPMLAKLFGVDKSLIGQVVRKQIWNFE